MLLALAVIALVAVAFVSAPPVQRAVWERVVARVEADTGWRLEAERVGLRLWPARVELDRLEAGFDGRVVATARRVEATWRWRDLMREVPRLRSLRVEAPRLDLRGGLPEARPSDEAAAGPIDPLRVLELERFELADGEALAALANVELAADGVRVGARLVDGRAALEFEITRAQAVREGRVLRLAPVVIAAEVADGAVTVTSLRASGAFEAELHGGAGWGGRALSGSVSGVLGFEPTALASWWDPELAARVPVSGRLILEGRGERTTDGRLEVSLRHVGSPLEVAGLEVVEVEIEGADGLPTVRVAGGWGQARVTPGEARAVAVAELRSIPVLRTLLAAGLEAPGQIPADLTVSGALEVEIGLPFVVDEARGRADLTAVWTGGRASLTGRAADGTVELERGTAEIGTASLEVSGRLDSERRVTGEASLAVADPAAFVEAVRVWFPDVSLPTVSGGAVTIEASLAGSAAEPSFSAVALWTRPEVEGFAGELARVSVAGGLAALEWSARIDLLEDARLEGEGSARPRDGAAEGRWRVAVGSVAAAIAALPLESPEGLDGGVTGAGEFTLEASDWSVAGRLLARQVTAAGRSVDEIDIELTADPERVAVTALRAAFAGGEVNASGTVGLEGLDAPLSLEARWRDLDPVKLVDGLPPEVQGPVAGTLRVGGTVARPWADASATWNATLPSSPVQRITLEAALADGTLRLATTGTETAAGPLEARATVPLGDVARPEWLWPEAPRGPVEVHLVAAGVDTATALATMGRPPLPASLRFDLRADARWDLADPKRRAAEVVLDGLQFRSDVENLVAGGPAVLTWSGDVAELEPVELAGPRTRVELAGRVGLSERDLRISAEAQLAPELTGLLPFPVRAEKPLDLAVELAGPWDAPVGSVHVRHAGGRLVLRDPPVVIGDLDLIADVEDGVVSIRSGSATLNRGTVQIGGGWDPESGQGIVVELSDVVFLLPGQIIARWSGELAIGPTDKGLALVEGELVLDGGVWDTPVSLAELIAGEADAPLAPDDPLFGILLDVDVRGRGGIRVENNLGRFDVGWSVLSVTGSAAEPRVVGEVRIAPGGLLTVGGQSVRLQRGTIELTGEPGAEPRVELIPEAGTTFGSQGQGASWDDLARVGLARGVTSALGLNNEALAPADIAVETEKPPATRFSIGQSLGRNLAIFFTTDLRQPQDTTTLLQLWNLRQLPGLALQGFTTSQEEWGWAAIERHSWGGSEEAGEGPVVRKVKLEGEWPLSKRRLRRSVGMRSGQPFDPFLVFVGELRLERALAAQGYYAAVVTGAASRDERRRTIRFRCEPGPRQAFDFRGDAVKAAWRREAVSLYLPPPLEKVGFEAIRGDLVRRFAAENRPDARVEVVRTGDVIVIEVERGPELQLTGPRLVGLPAEASAGVAAILGTPAELASLEHGGAPATARVERLLDREGFPDARVLSVRREPGSEKTAEIVVEVEPGPRLDVAGVRLVGEDPLDALGAERELLAPGSPLARRRLDDLVQRIRRTYREAGYAEAAVRADVDRGAEAGPTVVVRLEPGPLRTVDAVEIVGLKHLRDRTLRSGVTVATGAPLSPTQVDETVSKLAGFRPIQRVEARSIPTGPETSMVRLEVFEKDRWTAGGGARWSSDRGTEAVIDLRDDNLIGRGLSLNLRGRYATDEQDGLLLLSLPPPPGGRVTFSGSLHFNRLETPDFVGTRVEEIREATLEASYRLDAGSAVRTYTTFSRNIDRFIDDFFGPVEIVTDIVTLGAQWYQDRLDDPFLPTRGSYASADLGWSGNAIGSDVDTLRTFLTGAVAWTPAQDVTLYQSLRIGVAEALSGELDPAVKFKTGGQGTIRGFTFESVGPTENLGGFERVVGGGVLLILNEELRVRVWEGLRLAAFVDAGNVWEGWSDAGGALAVGAGIGFRWSTPIGPIWGDVAWPVANPGLNQGPRYYLGFGRPF